MPGPTFRRFVGPSPKYQPKGGQLRGGLTRGGAFRGRAAAVGAGQRHSLTDTQVGVGLNTVMLGGTLRDSSRTFLAVFGLNELFKRLARLQGSPITLSDHLWALGQQIFADSQTLVPVNTGHLKSTGFVARPEPHIVHVGYTAPYAPTVHETHPTNAKFLEIPFEMHTRRWRKDAMTYVLQTGTQFDSVQLSARF